MVFIPNNFKYHIENKAIGAILVLWQNTFTDNDMDLINNNPNILIEWYRGNNHPLSVDVIENDKFYPNTENIGKFICDMDLEYNDNIIKNSEFITEDFWNIEDGNYGIINEVASIQVSQDKDSCLFYYTEDIQAAGRIFLFEIEVKYTNASLILINNSENRITEPGKYKFILQDNIELPINIKIYGSGSYTELDNIYLKEITSPYLEIQNEDILPSYIRNINEPMGLDKLRILGDTFGFSKRSVDSNLVYFPGNNSVIDTGVSIDGSLNSFGIMMSFSLPLVDTGENQYIANGTGRRFVFIMHRTGDPLNVLHIGFGSQIFQVTLDSSLNFHAMLVNWNKDTGEFSFAIDGSSLSPGISGDFYSFTNYFYLGGFDIQGKYTFNGYLGGGVMSSFIINETTWLDFWDNNKDKKLIKDEIILDCNTYRFCEEPFRCGEPSLIDCEEFLDCNDELVCWY
jgi:hypothetical protein